MARSADAVHRLRNRDRFLRNHHRVHDVIPALNDAVLPQTDLVHIAALMSQIAAVLEVRSVALESVLDAENADTRMLAERLQRHLLRDLLFAVSDYRDNMAVCNRSVYKNTGRVDVRHDRHQIDCLMSRRLIDLQRVRQPAVIIARIRDAADDRDRNLLYAVSAVKAVNGTDQTGRVAAGELQIILVQALFIIRVAVEEHVRNLVLLAALENRLDARRLVDVNLVLQADSCRRRIEHDIDVVDKIHEIAFDRDSDFIELALVRAVNEIQIVRHALLIQSTDRECRRHIGDTYELHVLLLRNAVSKTLSDRAVSGNSNPDFSHDNVSSLSGLLLHDSII